MKRTFITLAAFSMLIAVTVFTSCNSASQKENEAETEVQDAQQNLDEAQTDANNESNNVATDEEWSAFKSDAELKIKSNDDRIAELNVKINKPGEILDPIYKKKIQTLEQQNRDLKARLVVYETEKSDWSTFKREFNSDMDELGNALKNLTVDNKN